MESTPDHLERAEGLSKETLAQLEQIRGFLSHSHPNASYSEIIAYLAKQGAEKLNPARVRRGEQKGRKEHEDRLHVNGEHKEREERQVHQGFKDSKPAKNLPPVEEIALESRAYTDTDTAATKAIPAPTRRLIWRRDQGRCTYTDPQTGRGCGSTTRLEIDHIRPRARGGGHELTNLRLRCQRHNLLAAVQVLGAQKMGQYVRA